MTKEKFDSWLNWNLKHGSHDFPGADGGTCVNEAALVVAGFAYREVTSISDLPESFCPVISQYALTLNDSMPEGDVLNRLRPFAARLSGSSDGRKTAIARAAYLAQQAATVFTPLAVETVDVSAAARLRKATDPAEALSQLEILSKRELPSDVREAVGAAHRGLKRALADKDAIYTAELASICAARAAAVDEMAWDRAVETLERALLIGKQADPIETTLIEERAAEVLAHL
jgi:hypothetical protein